MERLELKASAISESGLCKQENQDRLLALIGEGHQGDFGLFMVADGMGSQRGGAQAAEIAMVACEEWWNRELPGFIGEKDEHLHAFAIQSLSEVIHGVNESVMRLGYQLQSSPGTTVSALFIYGSAYSFVHIGDSRIYKATEYLEQITPDDTWVAHQLRSGSMSAAAARNHPNRHALTQCAGSGRNVHVHCGQGGLSTRTVFILCSDGFYNHVSDKEILLLLQSGNDLEGQLCESVKTIYFRGATDNLSAIIVAT